ncbi:zinc finger CCCH domain-containing protein 3 [Heptranchias perlo]|uniref:zinc finger CCCH domain-containing protein 3 n=1 Tax=Heptranchias perlo TaxID=212740 RepID=UPI00355944FA
MEERAALERQIRLLTALITNHKNVHGDVPAATAKIPEPCNSHRQGSWTSSNPKFTSVCSQKVPGHHGSQASSSWRTKYSLVNKKPVSTSGEAPANVSQGKVTPASSQESNSVGKCVLSVSMPERLGGKSYRTVQASPKAQSLLALNSELAMKNNKLLALKEKLDKVKMARRMDGIGAMTSLSAEGSTLKSARKQEEEGQALNVEKQMPAAVAGRTEASIPSSCRGVMVRGSGKIQHVEPSPCVSADPETSVCKLQKASMKGKSHCVAGETAQGAGKFQQVVESSDSAHAGPEASTSKLQKASVMHKIAELDKHTENDGVTLGKLQNVSNSLDQVPFGSSPIKRSKYTWQKVPDVGVVSRLCGCQNETLKSAREPVSVSTSQSQTTRVVGGSLKSKAPLPLKVLKKQRNNTSVCSRVSKGRKAKYVWVSNTAKSNQSMRSGEMSRKSVSPKLVKSGAKCVAGDDGTTLNPGLELKSAGRHKKAGCCHKRGASSNKYCWKATETVSPSKSLYQWKSQDSYETGPSGHRMRPVAMKRAECATDVPKKTFSVSGSSHYKVKSRTKIIRRKGGLSSPTERRNSLTSPPMVKSRYLLVKKSSAHGKSSPTLKRTPGKGLVQISKHRLRRLPASGLHGAMKQGLNSSVSMKSPSNNRLINTRYKIVKKNAAWNSSLPAASYSVSWKTRKVNSSRPLLLNRARLSSNYKFLQQRWKMKSMRCIGGVLYRVSANKLSKSCAAPNKSGIASTRSTVKSVRLEADFDTGDLYLPSSLTKAVTHRHIASRAVQRSLAIIRLAKQKKSKKKEYCMYYNRFGKCNRGDNCPYIHDPEKVAVCTRFLRGTCKKIDGTCPFSHKVSKDKMPVCSYYLRGICSNNNCPYSHVYVSRKAEVCRDFLKGYCPLGEKCKRKHTLVCPEFSRIGSCTQGSKCKLQHRQRKSHKRKHTSETSRDGTAEEGMTSQRVKLADKAERELKDETLRQVSTERRADSSVNTEELSSSSSQQWLPAFIALHSSASSEEKADSEVEEESAGEALGKPIRIKPRF